MKVGILGGTRFIGFHLVEALLDKKVEVSIFHRGKTTEPQKFSGHVTRFFGDRNKPSSLNAFFQHNYDAVIDLSGYNLPQVEPVLSHWREKIGHYIFCSTTSVYQMPLPVAVDETFSRVLKPGSYGGNKALVEDAILRQSEKYKWPVAIFRPQAVFGAFEAPPAFYIFQRLWAKDPVLVQENAIGKKLNFIWVQDLTDYFIRAIGNSKVFGQVFNMAGSEVHTPQSFGLLIEQIIGAGKLEMVTLNGRLADEFPHLGLPWNSYDLVVNKQKIEQVLGPCTPLEQALRRTWEWLRSEPGWLQIKRQRWEKQAREGRVPSQWTQLSWKLYDGMRNNFFVSHIINTARDKHLLSR